jgi:hypothetical protein
MRIRRVEDRSPGPRYARNDERLPVVQRPRPGIRCVLRLLRRAALGRGRPPIVSEVRRPGHAGGQALSPVRRRAHRGRHPGHPGGPRLSGIESTLGRSRQSRPRHGDPSRGFSPAEALPRAPVLERWPRGRIRRGGVRRSADPAPGRSRWSDHRAHRRGGRGGLRLPGLEGRGPRGRQRGRHPSSFPHQLEGGCQAGRGHHRSRAPGARHAGGAGRVGVDAGPWISVRPSVDRRSHVPRAGGVRGPI